MAKQAPDVPQDPPAGDSAPDGDAKAERRCQVCGLKLSNYNPGPNCWQHTIGYPWRGPTAKPRF